MSPPVHVLFFTGSLGTGGSETHLAQLLAGLDPRRVRAELLLLRAAEDTRRIDAVRAAGIPVHDLALQAGIVGSLAALRGAVGRIGPTLVHTYGYPCDVYAPLVTRRSVITTRRGNQPLARRRLLYRVTNPLVHQVVCVSGSARDFACRTEGLAAARCCVIPNGVDLARFPPRATERTATRVAGTHGRLGHIKGTDLLLEAFALLDQSGLSLQIAGPAVDPWSRRLRAAHEDRPGVRFLGDVSDVAGFLSRLDVFVLPSRSEGMSMALLEAMAAGRAIVATDVDSNREVLDDGRAGCVVPPDPRSIAKAIEGLLADPAEAARLGRAARLRVESEYGLDRMIRRYEDFYEATTR